jgi:hypothetical protein
LSQIKLRKNGALGRIGELKVYDCFVTQNKGLYFFVDYEDNDPLWLAKNR